MCLKKHDGQETRYGQEGREKRPTKQAVCKAAMPAEKLQVQINVWKPRRQERASIIDAFGYPFACNHLLWVCEALHDVCAMNGRSGQVKEIFRDDGECHVEYLVIVPSHEAMLPSRCINARGAHLFLYKMSPR